MGFLQDIMKRITEAYSTLENSNIGKMLSIVASEMDEVKQTFDLIELYRDVDLASGKMLDRIGFNLQQFRGEATDEVYRILIKTKIARNLSDGTVDRIILILSEALGVEPSSILIEEQYDHPTDPEPATIKMIQLPIGRVNNLGLSANNLERLIDSMLASGVGINAIGLAGTFSMSSLEDEIQNDIDTGLSDSLQDSGGFLGEVFQPGIDTQYPI